jgi:GT2 family glycosyltransferase
MDDYDISILIVNWNTRDLLYRCLSSVHTPDSRLKTETIVVDNNSNDGSVEMVSREFPHVTLVRNTENLGFAKACNQAIRLARSRLLLLLNSDAEICNGSLPTMVSFMDSNESVAAAGCRLSNRDGSLQRSYWNRFPSVRDALIENLYLYRLPFRKKRPKAGTAQHTQETSAVDVAHLLGACVIIRQEALADVGPFDEDYFMYLEETDWFYRAKQKGWRVCYLASAQAVHHGQQSSNLDPARVVPYLSKSYCRFVRKHYGNTRVPAIKAAYACGAVIRMFLWTKRWLSGPDRPLARRMVTAYSTVMRQIWRA